MSYKVNDTDIFTTILENLNEALTSFLTVVHTWSGIQTFSAWPLINATVPEASENSTKIATTAWVKSNSYQTASNVNTLINNNANSYQTASNVNTLINNMGFSDIGGGNVLCSKYFHLNSVTAGTNITNGSLPLNVYYNAGYYIVSTHTSSRKTKSNILDITPEESQQIYKMRPVKFNYNKSLNIQNIGFIAEEMYELEPRIVPHSIDNDGTVNPLSINYDMLTPLIIAEMKSLKIQVEYLTKSLEDLKSKI